MNVVDELIIPSMCCGLGNMKPKISIAQIIKALESTETINLDYNKILLVQPKYYENTEFNY